MSSVQTLLELLKRIWKSPLFWLSKKLCFNIYTGFTESRLWQAISLDGSNEYNLNHSPLRILGRAFLITYSARVSIKMYARNVVVEVHQLRQQFVSEENSATTSTFENSNVHEQGCEATPPPRQATGSKISELTCECNSHTRHSIIEILRMFLRTVGPELLLSSHISDACCCQIF